MTYSKISVLSLREESPYGNDDDSEDTRVTCGS